jgi:hypothetical protein
MCPLIKLEVLDFQVPTQLSNYRSSCVTPGCCNLVIDELRGRHVIQLSIDQVSREIEAAVTKTIPGVAVRFNFG